ncbi:hypothetical protein K2173_008294 [Erythroxylum novogranatense]|uniref:RNase H type-1 domain-containing protein n=1 Tax=Erythroxylum novogranatense TaxID=1862640 RepID=A0AAV8U3G7_9ROSI|nr:hypothetical protein K2173_008294 [Erythroxylum novogranatense]
MGCYIHLHHLLVLWNPPPVGCYKCNVDVFVVAGQHLFGMGMILRDSNGRGMMGQMRTIPGTDDPALGKALTFREALSWLKRTQARCDIMESDSLLLINALQSTSFDFSYFGAIVQDCKHLLSLLPSMAIQFVRKSANQAAHCIARLLWFYARFRMGIYPPSFCMTFCGLTLLI